MHTHHVTRQPFLFFRDASRTLPLLIARESWCDLGVTRCSHAWSQESAEERHWFFWAHIDGPDNRLIKRLKHKHVDALFHVAQHGVVEIRDVAAATGASAGEVLQLVDLRLLQHSAGPEMVGSNPNFATAYELGQSVPRDIQVRLGDQVIGPKQIARCKRITFDEQNTRIEEL
jgi:hypothetical protein